MSWPVVDVVFCLGEVPAVGTVAATGVGAFEHVTFSPVSLLTVSTRLGQNCQDASIYGGYSGEA